MDGTQSLHMFSCCKQAPPTSPTSPPTTTALYFPLPPLRTSLGEKTEDVRMYSGLSVRCESIGQSGGDRLAWVA